MADAHKNFAVTSIVTAPSPATTGTSVTVATGRGAIFPTPPFNAVIWPASGLPTPLNAEVVRVTAISTDTLTITRAQEGSTARTVIVGDQIAASLTAKSLTDIESAAAGGVLSGNYPNPGMAAGVASANIGALAGDFKGTAAAPIYAPANTAQPASPVNGQVWFYRYQYATGADPVVWALRFNSALATNGVWEVHGGPPMWDSSSASSTGSTASQTAPPYNQIAMTYGMRSPAIGATGGNWTIEVSMEGYQNTTTATDLRWYLGTGPTQNSPTTYTEVGLMYTVYQYSGTSVQCRINMPINNNDYISLWYGSVQQVVVASVANAYIFAYPNFFPV